MEFTGVGGLLLDSNMRFSSPKQEISQNMLYNVMDLYKGQRRGVPKVTDWAVLLMPIIKNY